MNIMDTINAIDECENALIDARSSAAEVLYKLIETAGIGKPSYESIVSCYRTGKHLYVRTEWSARSCINHSDYNIPLSIIDAEDPMKAAAEYKIAEDARQTEAKRQQTITEIQRLQRSLA